MEFINHPFHDLFKLGPKPKMANKAAIAPIAGDSQGSACPNDPKLCTKEECKGARCSICDEHCGYQCYGYLCYTEDGFWSAEEGAQCPSDSKHCSREKSSYECRAARCKWCRRPCGYNCGGYHCSAPDERGSMFIGR